MHSVSWSYVEYLYLQNFIFFFRKVEYIYMYVCVLIYIIV